MESKIVDSKVYSLKELFSSKFDVDFYQREYVWNRKQIEDLILDLTSEFMKNWKQGDPLSKVSGYDPYYMGEIVLSIKDEHNSIIDGQQRITTLTLLLIYLLQKYSNVEGFPKGEIETLIYKDVYGDKKFNLDIEERLECMLSLYTKGSYDIKDDDTVSVHNIIDRYNDIDDCWNNSIDAGNIVSFTYWIKEKVMFSKVWTNNDDFAYVIFETMNDRGLSLTQVEMLRSYLLANIDVDSRDKGIKLFDGAVNRLRNIKLTTRSKAEFEFFKVYFRGHYIDAVVQSTTSDFTRIGNEFHRWVRDNSKRLQLKSSTDFLSFIERVSYFAKVYEFIYDVIQHRDSKEYLYAIVNSDYGFTLQPALILSSIDYLDSDDIIYDKIKIVSKYLTKILSWRVWNHYQISQSSMETPIYDLCIKIREKTVDEIRNVLDNNPVEIPELDNAPILNQQNRPKLKVLISLITEIVASNSGESHYLLNDKDMEVEHIWANHYIQHKSEFENENDFATARNSIGDLLVLPKSFNSSYGDDPYEDKVVQYFSQNILAQSLNSQKYTNNPGFKQFIELSGLPFKPYKEFKLSGINERAELYKQILKWNWQNNKS